MWSTTQGWWGIMHVPGHLFHYKLLVNPACAGLLGDWHRPLPPTPLLPLTWQLRRKGQQKHPCLQRPCEVILPSLQAA